MKVDVAKDRLISEQFEELKNVFSDLHLTQNGDGKFVVAGNLSFTCSHDGKTVKDDYDVEISIPKDYPQDHPTAKEIGNKIYRNMDNHIYPSNGTLCLGSPLAVRRTFAQKRTLLWFVKEQVVRFLFSHSYRRDYGKYPFGELSHGGQGLIEYYSDLFSVKDVSVMLRLLLILCDFRINEHAPCPCRSGQRLKTCHLRILKKIRKFQSPEEFRNEYQHIIEYLDLLRDGYLNFQ